MLQDLGAAGAPGLENNHEMMRFVETNDPPSHTNVVFSVNHLWRVALGLACLQHPGFRIGTRLRHSVSPNLWLENVMPCTHLGGTSQHACHCLLRECPCIDFCPAADHAFPQLLEQGIP